MATPVLDDVQLPLAACGPCGRDVVAYFDGDEAGVEIRRCVHCDTPLLDWQNAGAVELEAAGYALIEARGCGNGGGCSGGCGMRR